ncbi:MAG: hypothetical protein GY793_05220, partial [Proteobacteria bacterium]|nr:hypothetical protein [Pseudomonadota bacterium]
ADPRTGKLKITLTTSTISGGKTIIKHINLSVTGKSDAEIANDLRDANIKKIEKKIHDIDIKKIQGTKKVADIVDEMKKKGAKIAEIIAAIKKITGVDLGVDHDGTGITDIILNPHPDGTIDIIVKTTTPKATPISKDANGKFIGNSNTDADKKKAQKIADINKPTNISAIKAQFKNATLTHQNGRTVAEVVKDIKKGQTIAGIIANINNETTANISEVTNGTRITGIVLKANPDGTITISLKTTTANATNPDQDFDVTVTGKSDAEIANDLRDANIKKIEKKIHDIDIK